MPAIHAQSIATRSVFTTWNEMRLVSDAPLVAHDPDVQLEDINALDGNLLRIAQEIFVCKKQSPAGSVHNTSDLSTLGEAPT